MKRLRVMSVFGVRPEAIKMAPVIKELERYPEVIESIVTVTGQHREMLDQVLEFYNIVPDYDLDIMEHGQTLTDIFERTLRGLEKVLIQDRPDIVLVHGDTSASFVSALAAFYQKIPVGHVEAGLRTYDKFSPYPEEINRRLTGVIADLHFAPTQEAKANLLSERISEENIFVTGNTVIDTLHYTIAEDFNFRTPELQHCPWQDGRLVVMEVHRRENWGSRIEQICLGVRDLVAQHDDITVVFPVHLNPVVRDTVNQVLQDIDRVILIEPLSNDEFHNLINKAILLISDSGGVQEEAPAMGTPVLVTREETERPEAVVAGTVRLVGTSRNGVFAAGDELLADENKRLAMAQAVNPYGDGRAAPRIVAALLQRFGYTEDLPSEWVYLQK